MQHSSLGRPRQAASCLLAPHAASQCAGLGRLPVGHAHQHADVLAQLDVSASFSRGTKYNIVRECTCIDLEVKQLAVPQLVSLVSLYKKTSPAK
jgi:hypothetical protein